MRGLEGRFFHTLFFLFGLLLTPSSAWSAIPSSDLTIPIQSAEQQGETHCTASVIKIDGVCHLVTAYHCVPGEIAPSVVIPVVSAADWVRGHAQAAEIPLQVLKRDAALDLAELEFPIRQEACQEFPVTGIPSESEVLGQKKLTLFAQGFVDHDLFHQTYSQNKPFQGISSVRLYRHGGSEGEVFFEFTELKIIPGMSGGLVFDGTLIRPLGVISHLIPFQKLAYVIPISVVADFLKNGVNRVLPGPVEDSLKFWHMINGAIASGDNAQVGGGNNSPAAGSFPNLPGYTRALTLPFKEPEEGVQLKNSSRVLLAVNGSQIDGSDDYFLKYTPVAGIHPELITREAGGYLDLPIRNTILQRLAGSYHPSNSDGEATLYVQSGTVAEGWKEAGSGAAQIEIKVDPTANLIEFHFLPYSIQSSLNAGDVLPMKDSVAALHLVLSADAKTLTATNVANPQQTYLCDNNNYLKLICADDTGVGFSLSLDRLGSGGVLSYRFAHLAASADRKLLINYYYGRLGGASP
jgi:hypothetical protein